MRPLVLSLTLNEYETVFGRMMQTHHRYADRHDADYQVVGTNEWTDLGRECTWIKIVLILAALEDGRPWVMFVDNDTVIRRSCPDFRSVAEPGKHVYMARGFSGRYNSGVMIVRNHPSSIAFFRDVLTKMRRDLPQKDDVGWGENGAVINTAHDYPEVAEISRRWNNNRSLWIFDHIRHYSAGPLRRRYWFKSEERRRLQIILEKTVSNICDSREAQIKALDELYLRLCPPGSAVGYYGAQKYFGQFFGNGAHSFAYDQDRIGPTAAPQGHADNGRVLPPASQRPMQGAPEKVGQAAD